MSIDEMSDNEQEIADLLRILAQQNERILELERQNALLLAVIGRNDELIQFIDAWEIEAVPVPLFLKLGHCETARAEAVDGGALDGGNPRRHHER